MNKLAFDALRQVNIARQPDFGHACQDWTLADWACALFGEAGEACNAVKKIRRGDGTSQAVADELADIVIYADMLAEFLGIDLGDAIRAKFNQTSDKIGSAVKL